jgi:hypothetical protein
MVDMTPAHKNLIRRIKEQLRLFPLAEVHIRFARKVVKQGTSFSGMELADNDLDAKVWKAQIKPQMGECFFNAQSFSMAYPQAKYYEGYFAPSACGYPRHHAWIVFKEKVFDFTCEAAKIEEDKGHSMFNVGLPLDPVYLGLFVPTDFIAMAMSEQGSGKPVGHLYHCKPTKFRKKSGQ